MLHVKTDAPPSAGARPPFRGHDEIYGNNPNANDFRKHLVNIDSRFRASALEPSTDFSYRFAHPYKNVIQARVASMEIPTGYYQFSRSKKNTMFRLEVMDWVGHWHFLQVTIPDGDYTPECLVATIQEQFHAFRDQFGVFFRIIYDARTRRVTITHDGSGPPPCPPGPTHAPAAFGLTFAMVGLENRTADFGLGFNLGFVNHFYTVDREITGESLLTTHTDQYFLLAIEDWYTVEHNTSETYLQCLAKILVKPTANGILFDGYSILTNEIVFPRPLDLKQVRIRLMDKYGQAIDLHRLNISISLEITEVMNVQLYDTYRTYLWNKAEPRAVRNVGGSAVALAGGSFN